MQAMNGPQIVFLRMFGVNRKKETHDQNTREAVIRGRKLYSESHN